MKPNLSEKFRIIEIIEREQRRIGQDLHDSLGQILIGISFISKKLEQSLTSKLIPEAKYATEITRLVSEAIIQTKSLVKTLNPLNIEMNGLMVALEELVFNTEKIFGISCHFNYDRSVKIKNDMIAINLYRIVQEAINNAIRHGNAKNILINLMSLNQGITLTVKDDGLGFSSNNKNSKGLGIKIMKCRARMIGARLNIRSSASTGTVLTCSLNQGNL